MFSILCVFSVTINTFINIKNMYYVFFFKTFKCNLTTVCLYILRRKYAIVYFFVKKMNHCLKYFHHRNNSCENFFGSVFFEQLLFLNG